MVFASGREDNSGELSPDENSIVADKRVLRIFQYEILRVRMRVLIVEEDAALGHFLCQGLRLDGHDVALVADGGTALASVARLRPELLMLDVGRAQMDCAEVLGAMSERFRSTSVLVLTAGAETEDRVRCLELGADDVVRKPFSFHELRARVRALGRRRSQFSDRVLRFGDLEMDRAERRVTQAGGEVELTATEFALLESLLRRRGEQVCSRSELLREVWRMPAGVVERGAATNIVEVYINYLRKKLNRHLGHGRRVSAHSRSVIRTVRGEGYLLDAVTSRMAEGWVANG
jgi:DNA-binding response OmpR family regulator